MMASLDTLQKFLFPNCGSEFPLAWSSISPSGPARSPPASSKSPRFVVEDPTLQRMESHPGASPPSAIAFDTSGELDQPDEEVTLGHNTSPSFVRTRLNDPACGHCRLQASVGNCVTCHTLICTQCLATGNGVDSCIPIPGLPFTEQDDVPSYHSGNSNQSVPPAANESSPSG